MTRHHPVSSKLRHPSLILGLGELGNPSLHDADHLGVRLADTFVSLRITYGQIVAVDAVL